MSLTFVFLFSSYLQHDINPIYYLFAGCVLLRYLRNASNASGNYYLSPLWRVTAKVLHVIILIVTAGKIIRSNLRSNRSKLSWDYLIFFFNSYSWVFQLFIAYISVQSILRCLTSWSNLITFLSWFNHCIEFRQSIGRRTSSRTRTRKSTRFSHRTTLSARKPASFWREKRDTIVILVQGFAKMLSCLNKSRPW